MQLKEMVKLGIQGMTVLGNFILLQGRDDGCAEIWPDSLLKAKFCVLF